MPLVQQFEKDALLTLSTLGAGTMIRQAARIDASRENGFRVTKSEINMTMTGKTSGEGPIAYGVECNFENVAAAQAAWDADPQRPSSDDARGKGTYMKLLGVIGLLTVAIPFGNANSIGMKHTISYGKNGWSIPEGSALNYWAMNLDSSALSSGTILQWTAEHFGVWLRD